MTASSATADTSTRDFADVLLHAKEAIAAKAFENAEAALLALIPQLTARELESPEYKEEALYLLAVSQRYLARHAEALDTLSALHECAPSHGRAYQEEGHNHKALGDSDAALNAYAWACHYNPALEASFRGQLLMLQRLDRPQALAQVKAQLTHLSQLPKPLVAVIDLLSQGKVLKAEELCRKILQSNPTNPEAMRLLADIGARLGVLDDAETLLESAHELAPTNVQVHIDYIQTLRKRQRFAAAREQSQKLLATNTENPQFISLAAVEAMQSGDFDEALALFQQVLARLPEDAITLTSVGHAEKTRGNYDASVAAYHRALASQPTHGEAFYSLANLKVYKFSESEVTAMREAVANARLPHNDRVYMNFALGKAFEDRKQFADSFNYYAQGNALKKVQSRYRAQGMTDDLEAQKRACTKELFAAQASAGCAAADPIFVLGLPRAGSTLVEQILASHSQVDGTLELPNILSLSQRLRRLGQGRGAGKLARAREDYADYPANLHQLDGAQLREFGEEFIEQTAIHRSGAPFFIDKMPNNFRHIGLIKLILPNAKIIDARRGPMACCFSGFKQLFAEGQEFSYSLSDIGQYYRDYVSLMAHWDEVLPGFVHRIENEKLIEDLEGEVRKLLAFCGLPFEQSCVEFHRNTRSVRTPSSEQVRQPISRSGVDQWRSYEPYLEPLRDALGDLYPV
jgi:tetratricopeptide (TPR) repeat protein